MKVEFSYAVSDLRDGLTLSFKHSRSQQFMIFFTLLGVFGLVTAYWGWRRGDLEGFDWYMPVFAVAAGWVSTGYLWPELGARVMFRANPKFAGSYTWFFDEDGVRIETGAGVLRFPWRTFLYCKYDQRSLLLFHRRTRFQIMPLAPLPEEKRKAVLEMVLGHVKRKKPNYLFLKLLVAGILIPLGILLIATMR